MSFAPYPEARPRRLRQSAWIRNLVREASLTPADLIWPIFICDGEDKVDPVVSMPGVNRLSIDRAVMAAREAVELGIPLIALFPNTNDAEKTTECAEAFNPENLVNRATRAIKTAVPDIGVMLDVALDPYNADGHDGLLRDGKVVNDATLKVLRKQALEHARAGADVLGPSDMMDGTVSIIRQALEKEGFSDVCIMAYSAKFASAFYGPFRDAVGACGTLKGDKKTYQIDPGNSDEAVNMVARDLAEGADMVMVKPGMPYLDICQRVREEFGVPLFAYQVSGEYAMIMAAAQNGWIDGEKAMLESLLAFKRVGCQGILTYFAPQVARLLQG